MEAWRELTCGIEHAFDGAGDVGRGAVDDEFEVVAGDEGHEVGLLLVRHDRGCVADRERWKLDWRAMLT